LFADKARDNMSGWGIGFFREGQVHIEKSCEGIFAGGQVQDSFQRLARVIGSRIIISISAAPRAATRPNPRSATHRLIPGPPLALQLYR